MSALARLRTAIATAGVALLGVTSSAPAQTPAAHEYKPLHRIGTAEAFARRTLPIVSSLRMMVSTPGMVDDIRAVLRQSGIPETADGVITTLSGATASVRGGSCSDSTPQDGTIVDCDFERGATLEWMAYRPNALKGNREPGRLERMRWAGEKSFRAYLFTVTASNKVYTFVLPMVCGNLSLMSVKSLGPVAGARVAPEVAAVAPPPAEVAPPAAVAAPAAVVPPPSPAPTAAPTPAVVPSQAAPVPTSHIAALEASPFFVDVLYGKERRVRPPSPDDARFTDWAQCSPLLGVKFGVAKTFDNTWEVAGAGGVAISLVTADDKVNQSALFIDGEVNKYVSTSFVGTGLSLWDLTRKDTFTPAWMFHFGIPLGSHATYPIYFLGEGRLFFDQIDDVSNNYQFWGGIRVRF